MRNSVAASVFILASSFATSTAQAQGAPGPFDWPPPAAVNWSGFYIGGQGGYQWSGIDLSWQHDLPGLGNAASLSPDGFMGGVHAGAQKQIGRWVIGVELTGNWGNNDDTAQANWTAGDGITCGRIGCFGLEAYGTDSMRASLDKLFTATGRLGYAHDSWLVYVKGGYASGEISTATHLSGEAEFCFFKCGYVEWDASGATEKTHTGYTLGGGLALMIARHVSLGVDYSYIHLGADTHRGTLSGVLDFCKDCEFEFDKNYKLRVNPDDIHLVSARLTLHFNEAPAPVASLK